ncbi:hypothetical protein JOF56_011006 [Kibdelosporangium banguiense]|uniref:DUF4229 domain-containing protein n=1 Tax=Kibdelosporangium banguiense TaxID=1365924 RepID=A0ABS4U1W2_9PSEU|nr:hypothetical protein [Kibdelosporangium banguiense]MBP2330621.1 hypothetical protein [Kibdelosporangium banguiense]
MSATEVLQRYGTWALLRFVVALLVFVALHLVRLPLVWLAWVLEFGMSRVDRLVTAGVSGGYTARPEREPLRHNDWR